MEFDLKGIKYDAEERTYTAESGGTITAKIRPYPVSSAHISFAGGSPTFDGQKRGEDFVAVVESWDLTSGGKPIPCTTQNKRAFYDFDLDAAFVNWAINESVVIRNERAERAKNSRTTSPE